MDRMLYVAMSGAKQTMNGLAVRANNLANANTTGFKADLEQARSMQAYGEGLPTRVFAMTESPAQNHRMGNFMTTGRELDVAIQGAGWLSVSDADGQEAYTRAGSLEVGNDGMLRNREGHPMLGLGGAPVFVPVPYAKLEIASDGTVSALPAGAPPNAIEIVGQLKMVNPDVNQLNKGVDGLFRQADGAVAPADPDTRLRSGVLEGSNVNAVNELTGMIDLQRRFELQVNLMKEAQKTDEAAASLLRIS